MSIGRRHRVVGICTGLVLASFWVGVPQAGAARTWTLSPDGTALIVTISAGEPVTASCTDGVVRLGADLTTGAACAPLTSLTINGSPSADNFDLRGMSPTAFPLLPRLTVNTKSGADTVLGGPMKEFVSAGDGDDVVRSGPGNDQVKGGAGNDVLLGDTGVDILTGDGGDDRLEGCLGLTGCVDDGRNTLYGGTGNDRIVGGPNADLVQGNDGNDRLQGGPGDDDVLGGNGDDVVDGDGFEFRLGTDRLGGDAGSDTIIGNNLDVAGDVSPEVDHFRWKVTFDSSPIQAVAIVSGQANDDIDLEVLNPGTWSVTGLFDGAGITVRQVRTDPLYKWRLNFDGFVRITMRMSAGDDKLYVVPSPFMVATVLGGPGSDRLSVPVTGDITQAVDTGASVLTPGNVPVAYAGFESVVLWSAANANQAQQVIAVGG